MSGPENFDQDLPVLGAIRKMLLTALPPDLRSSAFELSKRVAEHPQVAPHVNKLWGELSESEGDVIAREVAIVARQTTSGAAGASDSGEHLH